MMEANKLVTYSYSIFTNFVRNGTEDTLGSFRVCECTKKIIKPIKIMWRRYLIIKKRNDATNK